MRLAQLPKQARAGLLFVLIGAFALVHSLDYPVGTPLRMGPGFLPVCLSTLLILLGLGAVLRGWRATPASSAGFATILPTVMLAAGAIWFAFSIERFGLIPAASGLVLVVCYKQWRRRPIEVVTMAVAVAVFAAGLFVYALHLPFRVI